MRKPPSFALARAENLRRERVFAAAVLAALAASVPATAQFAELPGRTLAGPNSRAVALGDVDGDGDLDLVSGIHGQNQLHLGDGEGRLQDAPSGRLPAATDQTVDIALGDLDGDGDLDLVVANYFEQNRLHLNDGSGSFRDVTATHLSTDSDGSTAVALGDVDGDGDLDLVVANSLRQNRIHLNDGSGSFRDVTASHLPADADPSTSIAMGDVDGDGDLDLVIGNHNRDPYPGPDGFPNRVLQNDGTGRFTEILDAMPGNRESTEALALGDIDGDGDLDLVAGNGTVAGLPWTGLDYSTHDKLWRNDGNGTFTDVTLSQLRDALNPTKDLAFQDVDLDGDLDLLVGNAEPAVLGPDSASFLRRNDGSGTFAAPEIIRPASTNTFALACGDLDQDGDLDLIAGNTLQTNLFRQIHVPREPRYGDYYELEFYASDPSGGAVSYYPLLSSASANHPIPGLGVLRVDPTVAVPLPPVTVRSAAWRVTSRFYMRGPINWQLNALHVQALWIQGNAAGLTNASSDTIRR